MRLYKMRAAVLVLAFVTAALDISFSQVSSGDGNVGSKLSIAYSLDPNPLVKVTNNYSSPLTGLVVTVSSTTPPYKRAGIIWFDSGLNFRRDTPLGQGASRTYGVPPRDATTLKPSLGAAIFEDGTVVGDPQWVSKLHARRQLTADEIKVVTNLLNDALAKHRTNEQIVSSLQEMHASLPKTVHDQDLRSAAGLVIYAAISNLQEGGVASSIGDPQKTIPAAILPMFAEWRSSITRYDKTVN